MSRRAFLIIDDHPLFLEALQAALETGFPRSTVVVADAIGGAKRILEKSTFDLILLDLKMPDVAGYDGLKHIRAGCPKTPLAIISAMTGAEIIGKVKQLGADGFIHKSQSRKNILECIRRLLDGAACFPDVLAAAVSAKDDEVVATLEKLRQLTPQQLKVLLRVSQAKLNKQIAFEFGVTETTIKAHVTSIFKKLGIHSRTQAVLLMQKMRPELLNSEFELLLAGERPADAG